MGFGTLFIGYFLMLNIVNYTFTDIIATAVMLLGLYKLSAVSKHFVRPMHACLGFAIFALGELVFGIADLFTDISAAVAYVAMARALVLAVFTVILLMGMRDICRHLEVERLPHRCSTMILWTFIIYGANILLQTPFLTNMMPPTLSSILYISVLIGMIVLVCINLGIIYGCYMRICMPEDLEPKPKKPSRFGFVNEYRRRQEEKQREEAEAARRKFEEKMRRKKKK